MARFLFAVAVAALSATGAIAQTIPEVIPGAAPGIDQGCILVTTPDDWTALGLSPAQLEQVQTIQGTCKMNCQALGENGAVDAKMSQAIIKKHEEEIRNVLTPEQYNKWLLWCGQRPAHG